MIIIALVVRQVTQQQEQPSTNPVEELGHFVNATLLQETRQFIIATLTQNSMKIIISSTKATI